MTNRIVAIDFETANSDRSSVCALGVVILENGYKVKELYHLIRPQDLWFDPYNVRIHGITEKDVENKPEFDVVWKEVMPELQDSFVIAHNASFDMSVLRHVMDDYQISYPELQYSCTCNIARKVWSGLPGYGLNFVADHLQIRFAHHNALEDARACSEVAQRAMLLHQVNSIQELASKIQVGVGRLFPGGYEPARVSTERRRRYPTPSKELASIQPSSMEFDEEHPFFGCHIAFTGTLHSMEREQAVQFIVNCGAHFAQGVTKKTNFLVCGDQDLRQLKGKDKSSKILKAEDLVKKGQALELISERDFLNLLDSDEAEELSKQNQQVAARREQMKKYREERRREYSLVCEIYFDAEKGEVRIEKGSS